MPEIGTSGLMSGDGKRGGAQTSVPAPILDSTCPTRSIAPIKVPPGLHPFANLRKELSIEIKKVADEIECERLDREVPLPGRRRERRC